MEREQVMETEQEQMPKTVTVLRAFTYDVADIIDAMKEMGAENPTWQDVEEQINDWAHEDLRSPIDRHELIWRDENDNEL